MENRQNVRWRFLMAADIKKAIQHDFSFLYRFFILAPRVGSNQQPFG